MLTMLKRLAVNGAARVAVKLGNQKVAALEEEVANLQNQLAYADALDQLSQNAIETMKLGYGLVGQKLADENRKSSVIIGCLLLAQGGDVAVPDDVFKAVSNGEFHVAYERVGDKCVVRLVEGAPPAPAEPAEPFVDDTGCACDDAACVSCEHDDDDDDVTPAAAA